MKIKNKKDASAGNVPFDPSQIKEPQMGSVEDNWQEAVVENEETSTDSNVLNPIIKFVDHLGNERAGGDWSAVPHTSSLDKILELGNKMALSGKYGDNGTPVFGFRVYSRKAQGTPELITEVSCKNEELAKLEAFDKAGIDDQPMDTAREDASTVFAKVNNKFKDIFGNKFEKPDFKYDIDTTQVRNISSEEPLRKIPKHW